MLDGGVHFVAATRLLLSGAGEKIDVVSAFTAQLQEHLPPVDTVNAVLRLTNGASGTLSISFGTTDTGSEYLVACEGGSVWVSRGKVVVKRDGKVVEEKEFSSEGNGVKQEIQAWGESLKKGEWDARQSGEQALGDLEVIEAVLKSGEGDGKSVVLKLQ